MLEVGTGSGAIAQYFGTHPVLNTRVSAVDVVDQRQAEEGFDFQLVSDTRLPFQDATFDVVISNHVLEHVGEGPEQLSHLREIRRVLRGAGKGYLATPNRWALIEPHYRLPGLSWLPKSWRTSYLSLTRRGDHYDCNPVSRPVLDQLLRESGLAFDHIEALAVSTTIELELQGSWIGAVARKVPSTWVARVSPLLPTHVCLLEATQVTDLLVTD